MKINIRFGLITAAALVAAVVLAGCLWDGSSDGGTPEEVSVTITIPTLAETYATRETNLEIGGTASSAAAVESVVWHNTEASTHGTATGTIAWTADVDLVVGDNTIEVVATDSEGLTALDTITISREASIVVNSLEDTVNPASAGTVSLRDAIERAEPGERITFDLSLDGGTIELENIASRHSTLKGEVFILSFDPMPPHWVYEGFLERDYGASSLYAQKDLVIDASDLTEGVTLNWVGGEADPARVLAVYGDLTMENVNISSGVASAVFLTSTFNTQQYTLARGAGVAVWGEARLTGCEISGNTVRGEAAGSRDRGAFGGGIYGDVIILEDCVVSGNSVKGYGAAGGGIYSVGGWDSALNSSITRSAVTGNSIAGLHTYGGGVFTEGGGRENTDLEPLILTSSTIARNMVMHNPDIPAPDPSTERYYRGGGVYMSNGYLWIDGSTIAENVVTGYAATFHGEPNMSGGGVAATVGDAHVVEDMQIQNSIIVGNAVGGEAQDLFSGSLINFYSLGYNLIGELNFDYILVPVPWWYQPGYLSRKHYPKEGDQDGVHISEVLDVADAVLHASIVSAGTDSGSNALLYYPPTGMALDTVPGTYQVSYIYAGWDNAASVPVDLLDAVLNEVQNLYAIDVSGKFGTQDLSSVTFYGPAVSWPSNPDNVPWITFWRELDAALEPAVGNTLGTEKLADEFWGRAVFTNMLSRETNDTVNLQEYDQLGNTRPAGLVGDVGAIEIP